MERMNEGPRDAVRRRAVPLAAAPGWRGGSPSVLAFWLARSLWRAGREHVDPGDAGDGFLGGGGVGELRPGFLDR